MGIWDEAGWMYFPFSVILELDLEMLGYAMIPDTRILFNCSRLG